MFPSALLLLTALAGSTIAGAAGPAPSNEIVFTSLRIAHTPDDERRTIFVVRADGGGLTRLTPDVALASLSEPVWSPDRRKIAYTDNNKGRICVMHADGTARRCLAASGHGPSWSPDGKEIAYIPDHTDKAYADNSLVILGIGGRKRVLRVGLFPGPKGPDWSPDGRKIAFGGINFVSGSSIYVINVDGSGIKRLTHPPRNGDDSGARWSPDGKKLLFVREISEGKSGVYVMNPDGSHVRTLVAQNCCGLNSAVWSPEGRRIAYAYGRIRIFDVATRREHALNLNRFTSSDGFDW